MISSVETGGHEKACKQMWRNDIQVIINNRYASQAA